MSPCWSCRHAALGAGNDIEKGMYTLQEAMVRCAQLPSAVGFTYYGPPNPDTKVRSSNAFAPVRQSSCSSIESLLHKS